MLIHVSYSCSINYQDNTILLKRSFATVINMFLFFILVVKLKLVA